uniref:Uncharacterized protein n=1 Tax=Arundo donax TaxID=35708 RepID=A0A0A9FS97_ARUDO
MGQNRRLVEQLPVLYRCQREAAAK